MRPATPLLLLALLTAAAAAAAVPAPGFARLDNSSFPTDPSIDVPLAGFTQLSLHAYVRDSSLGPTDLARLEADEELLLRVWEDNYVVRATDGAGSVVLLDFTRPTWHFLEIERAGEHFAVTIDGRGPALVVPLWAGAPTRLTAQTDASPATFFDVRVNDAASYANRFTAPLASTPGWSAHVQGNAAAPRVLDVADGAADLGVLQVAGSRAAGATTYAAFTPGPALDAFEARMMFRSGATDPLNGPYGPSVLACLDDAHAPVWSLDAVPAGVGYHVALVVGDDAQHASPLFGSSAWHLLDLSVGAGSLSVAFDAGEATSFEGLPTDPCAALAMGDLRASGALAGSGHMRFDGFELRLP